MTETQTLTAARVPVVYFIDDSATMREVIKIAFRKEHIHVITCADAASALAQFKGRCTLARAPYVGMLVPHLRRPRVSVSAGRESCTTRRCRA